MEKNGFTTKKCNFQGTPGYIVRQYINGREIVEQFMDDITLKRFSEIINEKIEIID